MNRREHLQKLILRRLLLYGRTTRPELVALTGCRAATVFEAIDALKASGMVVEPERRGKKTGRRAPELECNRACACFIGIELKQDGIIAVATDCAGDILEDCEERPAAPFASPADAKSGILRCISELRRQLGEKWASVRGIGFADPGVVDIANGVSVRAVNFPGWENIAVGEWLSRECGLPAGVWTRQLVKTRMEYITRLPEAPESLFHLGTSGGIGGGFIKGGRLFVGSTLHEMEAGHLVVDRNGPVCSCGSRGCLEAVAGNAAIKELVREAIRNGVDTELTEENFSIRRFVECSHRDKAARLIAGEVSENIGRALASVVTLLNPAMIVVSGELVGMGSLLTGAIRRTLEENCFADAINRLKLELSTLEAADTARGAAMMMRDRVWNIDI